MKIYVAGPYTARHLRDTQRNVDTAIDMGIQIWKKGHFPYIPHLTHYIYLRPTCDLEWEDFIEWDKVWLDACDAFLYLGKSRGADLELKYAKSKGKIIFKNLDDIPFVPRQLSTKILNSCRVRKVKVVT